jgi:hypothetical protein
MHTKFYVEYVKLKDYWGNLGVVRRKYENGCNKYDGVDWIQLAQNGVH